MATTTTNYGFDVPTSSDLVKNGATAISTLGQDIDTFLFRPFTRNGIINGGFDIAQRGTSIGPLSSVTQYVLDRWFAYLGSAPFTFSQQSSGLTGIRYAMRMQKTSGSAVNNASQVWTGLETNDSIRFAGQSVTLSYYARKGANYSEATSAVNVIVRTGTGTDEKPVSYTGSADLLNTATTLTTSWQRFTHTFTVGSTATEIGLGFGYTPVGTAGANDYFEVTGVQLEVGSQASPFIRNAGTIQGELAACQRYYVRFGDTTSNATLSIGTSNSAGTVSIQSLSLPVAMRIPPATLDYANIRLSDGSTGYTISSASLIGGTTLRGNISCATSGMTAFRLTMLDASATGNYVGFSAEL